MNTDVVRIDMSQAEQKLVRILPLATATSRSRSAIKPKTCRCGQVRCLTTCAQVSRREFLNEEVELSTAVKDHKALFFSFMKKSHQITMMMLARLSDEMGREGANRFEAFHANTSPTLTNLAVLMYPKHDEAAPDKVGHNKHTDIGSLTLLLAKQWGLQILSATTGKWEFVTPRPGHAVSVVLFTTRPEISLIKNPRSSTWAIVSTFPPRGI